MSPEFDAVLGFEDGPLRDPNTDRPLRLVLYAREAILGVALPPRTVPRSTSSRATCSTSSRSI